MALTWADLVKQANNRKTDNAEHDYDMANIEEFGTVQPLYENGQLTALNMAAPGRQGWNQFLTNDGTGGVKTTQYEQKNGLDPDFVKMALIGGGLGYGFNSGLFGNLATGSEATGGFAPEIATESGSAINPAMHFSDAAFDSGLSNAYSPITGIDSALSMPEYANENAKFMQQAAAEPGSLLNTSLPTIDLGNVAQSFPYKDVAKLASSLTKGASSGYSKSGGGYGGMGSSFSNTPVMPTLGQAPGFAQQQQPVNTSQIANPAQPNFNFSDYQQITPLTQATQLAPVPNAQKLAQALRDNSWQA